MPSFSIPLSGLKADSTALNTIANDLSNMNTTAYKSQSVSFSDLFYQQIGNSGSGDPLVVGAGVRVGSTSTDFTTGGISSTGTATDMAIDGNGFFIVQSGGTESLTRAGNFTMDNNGNLTTQDGQSVMGYAAVNGVVNTSGGLIAINIPKGQVEQPKVTTSIGLTANLNAASDVGTSYPAQITVYDSLGVSHVATVDFTKTADNTWSYSISLPTGDASTSTNTTGTLQFDSNGNLTSPTSDVTGISFGTMADGASDLSFSWSLYGSSGKSTISQVASDSTVSSKTQDGYAGGQYSSFTVDSSGVISVKYDNGQQQVVGQVAIATVANEDGLKRIGSNLYETTLASGQATVGIAGSGGRGSLESESLEGSNVDISTEFSNLIVAQRAFEANSKAITTFDSITQETINMIH